MVVALGAGSPLPVSALLHLLFPSCCASCGSARRGFGGGGLCRACWKALPVLDAASACETCALPSSAPRCRRCSVAPPPVWGAAAAASYEGVARRLVHALKFRGHDTLVAPSGERMTDAARARGLDDRLDAVVAVPSTALRNRDRGYDPAALLAEEVARRLGRPFRPFLSRVREAPPQSRVPASARLANVRGAFASSPRVRGLRLLLVDDVMTTGATAFEAARALGSAGASAVALLVLARTPEVRQRTPEPPENA